MFPTFTQKCSVIFSEGLFPEILPVYSHVPSLRPYTHLFLRQVAQQLHYTHQLAFSFASVNISFLVVYLPSCYQMNG